MKSDDLGCCNPRKNADRGGTRTRRHPDITWAELVKMTPDDLRELERIKSESASDDEYVRLTAAFLEKWRAKG